MRTHVTFPSAGLNLAGHLYVPDTGASGAGLVIGHQGGAVKEQAPAVDKLSDFFQASLAARADAVAA